MSGLLTGERNVVKKEEYRKELKWVKAKESKQNCTKAGRAKNHAQEFRYLTLTHIQDNCVGGFTLRRTAVGSQKAPWALELVESMN